MYTLDLENSGLIDSIHPVHRSICLFPEHLLCLCYIDFILSTSYREGVRLGIRTYEDLMKVLWDTFTKYVIAFVINHQTKKVDPAIVIQTRGLLFFLKRYPIGIVIASFHNRTGRRIVGSMDTNGQANGCPKRE